MGLWVECGANKEGSSTATCQPIGICKSCEHQYVVMDACSIRWACENWESALVFLVVVLHADNDKQH